MLALHAAIRDDLDAVLAATTADFADAAADLEHDLERAIDVSSRVLYPMVERLTSAGDDAVWSAQLHGLDALEISSGLEIGADGRPERRRLDRLAYDVRRHLAANEQAVYPLLRLHLDGNEQTDLADAIDEVLEPQR